MPFAWRRGLHVVGTTLWCDARRAPGIVFASRADAEASGLGVIATPMTSKLRAALGLAGDVLAAPYGKKFSLGPVRVELYPTGLLPGAAGALLEVGGQRLAYAGVIGKKGAEQRPCDVLCVHAPAIVEVATSRAAQFLMDRTQTSIFLAPGLAEAVSLVRELEAVDMPLRAPPRLRAALRLLGVATLPFRGTPSAGECVVWPLQSRHMEAVKRIPRAAIVTLPALWATEDNIFDYVMLSGAEAVVAVGPGALDLVMRLRKSGVQAQALGAREAQLGLFHEVPCSA